MIRVRSGPQRRCTRPIRPKIGPLYKGVPHVSETSEAPQWEYFVTPLLLHNEAQILNNWGAKGWELVQIIEGPAGGNVAYMKRKKA